MNYRLTTFEEKIEEYYLSCMPKIARLENKEFLREWPLYKFSIVSLHSSMAASVAPDVLDLLGEKLIDIKLHYCYLLTVHEYFYPGATIIVGNDEIDKLNPKVLSLLRGIHYRVYLLSVIIEQTLDLLHLALEGKPSNVNKRKWGKLISIVQSHTQQEIISLSDLELIERFKNNVRTAEMHKFSMVRALTGKEHWTLLQDEELAVARILANVYSHFVQSK
jgi:hypothetical protein